MSEVRETQLHQLGGQTRIGWIGTGVMGLSMCGHIMKGGYATTVYNRTISKAQPLLEQGAQLADSPEAVARQSDIVFSIVGFPQDVQEVYLGKNGILAGAKSGSILVDMTTTAPSLAQEIDQVATGERNLYCGCSGFRRGCRRTQRSTFHYGWGEPNCS